MIETDTYKIKSLNIKIGKSWEQLGINSLGIRRKYEEQFLIFPKFPVDTTSTLFPAFTTSCYNFLLNTPHNLLTLFT